MATKDLGPRDLDHIWLQKKTHHQWLPVAPHFHMPPLCQLTDSPSAKLVPSLPQQDGHGNVAFSPWELEHLTVETCNYRDLLWPASIFAHNYTVERISIGTFCALNVGFPQRFFVNFPFCQTLPAFFEVTQLHPSCFPFLPIQHRGAQSQAGHFQAAG